MSLDTPDTPPLMPSAEREPAPTSVESQNESSLRAEYLEAENWFHANATKIIAVGAAILAVSLDVVNLADHHAILDDVSTFFGYIGIVTGGGIFAIGVMAKGDQITAASAEAGQQGSNPVE